MTLAAANEFLNLPATGPLTDDQRDLLATAAALPPLRPETPRTGNGRYKLPDPETGKPQSTTRATTFASALDGGHMLEAWVMRQTAIGVAAHPDLAERINEAAGALLAAESTGSADGTKEAKRLLNGLAERAKTLSGADTNREIGTALHAVAERLDHGVSVQVPTVYAADLEAREHALAAAGLARPAEWVERVVTLPDLGVTGTLDRIAVEEATGELVILDDKFGGSMDYSWAKTMVQLALYARAPYMWDFEAQAWIPKPGVAIDRAYVCHTPAGTGTSTVHRLDLTTGWELVEMCRLTREHTAYAAKITRQGPQIVATHQGSQTTPDLLAAALAEADAADKPRRDALITAAQAQNAVASSGSAAAAPGQDEAAIPPAASSETSGDGAAAPDGPAPMDDTAARSMWIVDRLRNIKASGNELAMTAVNKYWPDGAAPPPGPWGDEHVTALDVLLTQVERQDSIGFAPADPTIEAPAPTSFTLPPPSLLDRDTGEDRSRPSEAQISDLVTHLNQPEALARIDVIRAWIGDARRAGRVWSSGPDSTPPMTLRQLAIQVAATACSVHLLDAGDPDDSLVRAALEEILGDLGDHTTGAVLGCLTLDEAQRLTTLATGFGAGDDETVAALGARLSRQFAAAS